MADLSEAATLAQCLRWRLTVYDDACAAPASRRRRLVVEGSAGDASSAERSGIGGVGIGGPLWKQWEAAWAPPLTSSAAIAITSSPFAVVAAMTLTSSRGRTPAEATALLASAIDDACGISPDVKARWLDAREVVYAHAVDQDPTVDADVADGLRQEERAALLGSVRGDAVDPALLFFATQLFDQAVRWAAAQPALAASCAAMSSMVPCTRQAAARGGPARAGKLASTNPALLLPHNQDTPPTATPSAPPTPPRIARQEEAPINNNDNGGGGGGDDDEGISDEERGCWCSAPLVHTAALMGTGLPLPVGTYLPAETVAMTAEGEQKEFIGQPPSFEPVGPDASANLAKMMRIAAAVFGAAASSGPPATVAAASSSACASGAAAAEETADLLAGAVGARGIMLPREQSLRMAMGRAVEGRKRLRLLAETAAAGGASPTAPEASPLPRPPPTAYAGEPSPLAGPTAATAAAAAGTTTVGDEEGVAARRTTPSYSCAAIHRPNPFDVDYPRNPRVPRLWVVPDGVDHGGDATPSLVGITMSAETFGNTADDAFGIPDAPALTVLRPASPGGCMRPERLIRWVTSPTAAAAKS